MRAAPNTFCAARDLLDRWSVGRRDEPVERQLAGLLSTDDLTRLVWLFPDDEGHDDRVLVLELAARHAGSPLSPLRLSALRLRRPAATETEFLRIEGASEPGSLDRCLVLHDRARRAAQVHDSQGAARLERELARHAHRARDVFFAIVARLLRGERLLAEDEVGRASAVAERARRRVAAAPGHDVLEPRISLLIAMIQQRQDEPRCLWSYLALRKDLRLAPQLRDLASLRASEVLNRRRQLACALAIRLDLVHRTPPVTPVLLRARMLLDLATDLLTVGEIDFAMRHIDECLVLGERRLIESSLVVTALGLKVIAMARLFRSAGAAPLLAEARELAGDGLSPRVAALLAYAELALLDPDESPDESLRLAESALAGLDRTADLGPWGTRIALVRESSLRVVGSSPGEIENAINDAIAFAATAGDGDRLGDAYFRLAQHYTQSAETSEAAFEACRQAERLSRTSLDSLSADRDILFDLFPQQGILKTVVSALLARMHDHANRALEDLVALSTALVERTQRGHELVQELERSHRRMARILDNLPVIIWTSHGRARDFKSRHIAGAVEDIFGRRADAFTDSPDLWLELIHPEHRDAVVETLTRVEASLNGDTVEFPVPREHGASRWVEMRIMPILGEAHDDGTLHGIMTDVTERRLLHDELRQVQKMDAVGQLARGVAHEFSNILGGVLGAANLLASSPTQNEETRRLAGVIEKAALRGAELTSRIRSFGVSGPEIPKPLDLNALARETCDLARYLVGPTTEVVFEGDAEALSVVSTHASLTQAILNVIINAHDARPRDGRVVVSTAGGRDRVTVSVVDRGGGMDATTVEKAFDPFFTTKRHGQAPGLGLTIVYRIMRESGGDVALDSEPGVGTTVRLSLPRGPALTPEVERGPQRTPKTRLGGRLLLIEDDPETLAVVRMILESAGFEVVSARDGREGLELFREAPESWTLVVTDVRMPRFDGMRVVGEIRKLTRRTPILMMTAYADEEPVEIAVAHPNLGLIRKPFTSNAFLRSARALLLPESRAREGQWA